MRPIPQALKDEMEADPWMHRCARAGPECSGRVEWEHVFLYQGRQLNERWAIIPLCKHHHRGDGLDKRENERIALARITTAELEARFPRTDWSRRKWHLEQARIRGQDAGQGIRAP